MLEKDKKENLIRILDANEARKITDAARNETFEESKLGQEIGKDIENASKNGGESIMASSLSEYGKRFLTEKGYILKDIESEGFVMTKISW